MYNMAGRWMTAALLAVCWATPASAQEWARKMFSETQHNFGTIARGAKAEFEFPFTNLYKEDVHIASVRSSCGCTNPSIKDDLRTLKSWEKGAIVARINSGAFLGDRGATLTVSIDRPFRAEVQLQVKVYIRDDILFEPGSVQFGAIDQGVGAVREVTVSFPNRANVEIREVRSPKDYLVAQATRVDNRGWAPKYLLRVRLTDKAPVGYLSDHLVLITSDRQRAEVPIAVEGLVQPAISVSPSWLLMGVLRPGESVTKQIVVRGRAPFVVTGFTASGAEASGSSIQVDLSASQTKPKAVQIVPVTLTAGQTPGKVSAKIQLATTLGGATVELTIDGMISLPPADVVAAQHSELIEGGASSP